MITLNKEKTINDFKNMISTKINGDQIKNAGDNRTLLYINDMDAITTQEDLVGSHRGNCTGS